MTEFAKAFSEGLQAVVVLGDSHVALIEIVVLNPHVDHPGEPVVMEEAFNGGPGKTKAMAFG